MVRNPVRNPYGCGGARCARRRSLIHGSEQVGFGWNQNSFSENKPPEDANLVESLPNVDTEKQKA